MKKNEFMYVYNALLKILFFEILLVAICNETFITIMDSLLVVKIIM
jgi:hypothetical protein